MFPKIILLLFATILLLSCAQNTTPTPDPTRQPWRDSCAALENAKRGDDAALKKMFEASQAQLMLPYINGGEYAEGMIRNMGVVLDAVGDNAFSETLSEESPRTRSAVKEFLSEEHVKKTAPKTHQLLAESPVVIWPSDEVTERDSVEHGDPPVTKPVWSQ